MKVTTGKPKFTPVILTLESQEEVDKIFAIMNYTPLHVALNFNGVWEQLDQFKTNEYYHFHDIIEKVFTDN